MSAVPQDELKKNSIRSYEFVLSRFESQFRERELDATTSDEILSFLNQVIEGTKQSTKRSRYSALSSFFNFVKNTTASNLENPCSTPMLRKLFKPAKITHWTIPWPRPWPRPG
ncbi:MAG: phage integrase N-terminal SAM-like domain-containing protein [Desulfobacterales bacterium]|nr:phage integrase N-terminal SAM-like domain-containing protein [Desulfobacterales bacterium]